MNVLRINFNVSLSLNKISEQSRWFYHTQVGDFHSEWLKTRSRLSGPGGTWHLSYQRLQIQQEWSEVFYGSSAAELTLHHEDTRLRSYMSHISAVAWATECWEPLSPEMRPSAGKWQSSEHGLAHTLLSLVLWYFLGRQDDLGQARCARECVLLHLTMWRVKLGNFHILDWPLVHP